MLLKDLFSFLPKSKRSASEGKEKGLYPFFTSSNIQDKYIDEYDYDGEYLVIGDGGKPNCKFINGKFSTSDHNYVLKPNSLTNSKSVMYFLLKNNYEILIDGFKGCGLKNISKKYIENIDYKLNPDFDENTIVKELDKITSCISKNTQQINLLDELVKSEINNLIVDSKLNPNKYLVDKLENMCTCICAGGDRPKEVSEIRTDKFCYPIYSNGEKNDGLYGWSSNYKISKPSVTVSGRGTIGYASYRSEGKFTPIVRLIVLTPNDKIDPIYLTNYLNFEREDGSGSGVQQLTVPMIKQKTILVPALQKQHEFANFVKKITKLKSLISTQNCILYELLNKKINEYF